jgi:hypothetical protein
MTHSSQCVVFVTCAGCLVLFSAATSFAQADREPEQRRSPTISSRTSPSSSTEPRRSPGDNRVPLQGGGRRPLAGDPPRGTSSRGGQSAGAAADGGNPSVDRGRSAADAAADAARRDRERGRHRRPPPLYYDPWVYDRYRGYDDGYRGYDEPLDVGSDRYEQPAAEDEERAEPADGLLPPEYLMGDEEDQPAALRKALEASPEYREATVQLLRAWAEYNRAADRVLRVLYPTQPYRRAQAKLREAETKVAAVRDRAGNAADANLLAAAEQALRARRDVRSLEEQAIDADAPARRAREKLDGAIERRNKIREEIAAKLGQEKDAAPAN